MEPRRFVLVAGCAHVLQFSDSIYGIVCPTGKLGLLRISYHSAVNRKWKMKTIEPVIILLSGMLVFMVVALFCAEIFFKDDSAFFQVVSNMSTGILGALLGIMTKKTPDQPNGSASTQTPTVK